MKRTGTIYTYTVVYSAAEDFKKQTPYVLAMVEENGRRSVGILEGYDANPTCNEDDNRCNIEIGMEVEFAREDAEGNPIYKIA